jgi:predicted nucleic acid-binding protein
MERIFLDTNVLLDFVLDRKPFSDQIEELISFQYSHKQKLFASALSFANLAFVVRKAGKDPVDIIQNFLEWINLVNLTKNEFELSCKSNFKDFEDALQFYSALSVKADVIITRNAKDFAPSTIPVNSPLQFLKSIK